MRAFTTVCLAPLALGMVLAPAARADEGWHHHDPAHFDHYDYRHWRTGHWAHVYHYGRSGWWWVAGGMWYYFPQPIYPYPDPYRLPPGSAIAAPPPTVVLTTPAEGIPATPASDGFWYYCRQTGRYYPNVAACPGPWERIAPRGRRLP